METNINFRFGLPKGKLLGLTIYEKRWSVPRVRIFKDTIVGEYCITKEEYVEYR